MGTAPPKWGLYRAESDASAPWDCPHLAPQLSLVIVSQTSSRVPRRNVHCSSHRSSHRIRHRNGHRILDWTLTCISTWILNRISTLTSTSIRRCTSHRSSHCSKHCSHDCPRHRSAHCWSRRTTVCGLSRVSRCFGEGHGGGGLWAEGRAGELWPDSCLLLHIGGGVCFEARRHGCRFPGKV